MYRDVGSQNGDGMASSGEGVPILCGRRRRCFWRVTPTSVVLRDPPHIATSTLLPHVRPVRGEPLGNVDPDLVAAVVAPWSLNEQLSFRVGWCEFIDVRLSDNNIAGIDWGKIDLIDLEAKQLLQNKTIRFLCCWYDCCWWRGWYDCCWLNLVTGFGPRRERAVIY